MKSESIETDPSEMYENLGLSELLKSQHFAKDYLKQVAVQQAVSSVNLLLIIYSIFMFFKQARNSSKTFFRSFWAYNDLAYIFINGIITLEFLSKGLLDKKQLRVLESILSVIIMFKLVYFT